MDSLIRIMEVLKNEEEPGLYLVKFRVPVNNIREVEDHLRIYNIEYTLSGDIFEVYTMSVNIIRDIVFILAVHHIL